MNDKLLELARRVGVLASEPEARALLLKHMQTWEKKERRYAESGLRWQAERNRAIDRALGDPAMRDSPAPSEKHVQVPALEHGTYVYVWCPHNPPPKRDADGSERAAVQLVALHDWLCVDAVEQSPAVPIYAVPPVPRFKPRMSKEYRRGMIVAACVDMSWDWFKEHILGRASEDALHRLQLAWDAIQVELVRLPRQASPPIADARRSADAAQTALASQPVVAAVAASPMRQGRRDTSNDAKLVREYIAAHEDPERPGRNKLRATITKEMIATAVGVSAGLVFATQPYKALQTRKQQARLKAGKAAETDPITEAIETGVWDAVQREQEYDQARPSRSA
jgi:hypothetical protein